MAYEGNLTAVLKVDLHKLEEYLRHFERSTTGQFTWYGQTTIHGSKSQSSSDFQELLVLLLAVRSLASKMRSDLTNTASPGTTDPTS